VHAFRNAVDHGIEFPAAREESGKNPEGLISVSFAKIDQNGSPWLEIKIQDDGGGIDPAKIRERLSAKGMDVSQEDDEQIIQHVFDSQFSTKTVVTETSGRGVGMDAILHSAQKLGGKAFVTSQIGKGTCLSVQVPYLQNVSGLKAA
jgi:two-component system chemotaxis sensor kinase CheA